MQIVKKFMQGNPLRFIEKMEDFEKHHLNKPSYTPEYKAKLDKVKQSLMEECRQNLNGRSPNGKINNQILGDNNTIIIGATVPHDQSVFSRKIFIIAAIVTIFGGGGVLGWLKMCSTDNSEKNEKNIVTYEDSSLVVIIDGYNNQVHTGDFIHKEITNINTVNLGNRVTPSPPLKTEVIPIPNSYYIKSNEDEFCRTKIITNHLSQKLSPIVADKTRAENIVNLQIHNDTLTHRLDTRGTLLVSATVTITNKNGTREPFPLLQSKQRDLYNYDILFRNARQDINRQIDSIFNKRRQQ